MDVESAKIHDEKEHVRTLYERLNQQLCDRHIAQASHSQRKEPSSPNVVCADHKGMSFS